MRLFRSILPLFLCASADAEQIVVAVASNFIAPFDELAQTFQQTTGHVVLKSAGSTGMLYASISNGAGYAAFLAADTRRPALLEKAVYGVADTRFTYAIGGLELWSFDPRLDGSDCREALESLDGKHLAIANPELAPYGVAAKSFLEYSGLWDRVENNLVFGQNIAQTLQFVVTGNASLGFISAAQANSDRLPLPSCRWPVPRSTHAAVEQQAVLLASAAQNDVAKAFLDFLRSEAGKEIIRAYGYGVLD